MSTTPIPAAAPGDGAAEGPTGFTPPPYPYDRLAAVAALAARHPGGLVDLSVGTPCDPPPEPVVRALSTSGAERSYPSSVGSTAYREAAASWMRRRFGVVVDCSAVAACVGTKELVATTAWFLRLRRPERDTVLHPAVAYPTYAMGATLAGCRAVGVPEAPGGGLDLHAVDGADAARAVLLWVNSPANPSGSLTDLEAAAAWGRRHGVPVLSDECYAEFTWPPAAPTSILQYGTEGVLAVHSLSKRSNLAGVRAGCYAGDPDLVGYLSEVRKHAGFLVPGPVQAAAVAAWNDDEHVAHQRARYQHRLELVSAALARAGLEAPMPRGGFYLWVPVPDWAHELARPSGRGGAWLLAETLAVTAGVLVSPGEFYGAGGAGHVRLAVVQPDGVLEDVAARLASAALEDAAAGLVARSR